MDDYLLSNTDEKKKRYLFKIYSGTMLFLSLIPQSILLYYFYVTEKKLEKVVTTLNVTEISEYVDKIKHLVDFICDTQGVCNY